MNTHPGTHVYPETIRRVYKLMKLDPNKDMSIKDFCTGSTKATRNALNLLVALQVIEIVPATYMCGNKMRTRREVKRYRLIKHHRKPFVTE